MRLSSVHVLTVLALCSGLIAATAAPAISQASTGTPLAQLLERSGAITIKVKYYDAARQRALDIATAQGAEVLGARTTVNFQGKKAGFVTIKLDSNRLPGFLPLVLQSGKLYADKITSADHISEYEELARRIDRLKEHEQRLAGVLQSPRRMRGSDILYLQERLFRASVDQSLLEQRRIDIVRSARSSTITVQFFESVPPHALDIGNRYASSMLRAHESLQGDYQKALTATAFAITFAPVWVPVLIIAVLLIIAAWRLRFRVWALCLALFSVLVTVIRAVIVWTRHVWDEAQRREAMSAPTMPPG